MKILAISDTHQWRENIEKVLELEKGIDLVLHMGDSEDDMAYIESICDCPVEAVRGNCDYGYILPETSVVEPVEGIRMFMTHGHRFGVKSNEDRLVQAAKDNGASVALYGHTHEQFLMEIDGVLVINPGSLTYPRPRGQHPGYAVLEVLEGQPVRAWLKSL